MDIIMLLMFSVGYIVLFLIVLISGVAVGVLFDKTKTNKNKQRDSLEVCYIHPSIDGAIK